MAKVLTIRHKLGARWEIHLLNPGQTFPQFGSSQQGLVVRKTASMIVRTLQSGTKSDYEIDIYNEDRWEWLAMILADRSGDFVVTTGEKEKPVMTLKQYEEGDIG